MHNKNDIESGGGALMGKGPISLTAQDLCVTVNGKNEQKEKIEKNILNKVSFHVKSGTMVAILGPSGAGKTTLLNMLTDRKRTGEISGNVLINGGKKQKDFKRKTAYVMQEDILTTTLTVRETVLFSARLRIPNSVTLAEKEAKVDKILEQLGLSHVSENIIGEPGARGISGGERKRVSIAIEMVTDPSLLFLDEPTSSIDSTSAYGVVDHLKKLCTANGTTVIATIHQPSSQVFLMFDKVLLLSEGRQLYYGDSGDIVDYFTNYGFTAPKLVNPADYICK